MEKYIEQVLLPRYQAAAASNDCFCLLDLNGCYLLASSAWAQELGFNTANAIYGQSFNQHNLLPEAISADILELSRQATASQRGCQQVYSITKLNSLLKVKIEPLFLPNGEVLGCKISLQDFKYLHPLALIEGLAARQRVYKDLSMEQKLLAEFDEDEMVIMFMLSLQFTRQQIANYTGMHISRITRLITKIGTKVAARSNSQEQIIAAIIARGFHRYIPSSMIKDFTLAAANQAITPTMYRLLA